uniref:Uncharacterized protein n=1 Tax=Plectus sambesii TaxID=2011161 RepID=A0A914XP93_9BILA
MLNGDEKKVSLAGSEQQPTSPTCICSSARTVALISAYAVIPTITCLMIYFVTVSQESEELLKANKDILITSTCFLSIIIVGFAASFLYGVTYERRYFMIPYIIASVLALLAALVVTIGGSVWADGQGLWHTKPVVISLVVAASAVLAFIEAFLLVSYIRCYQYFVRLEQYKTGVIAAA